MTRHWQHETSPAHDVSGILRFLFRREERLKHYLAIYPLMLLFLSFQAIAFAQEGGFFAVLQIAGAYLFLPLLLLLPLILIRGTILLRFSLALCALMFVLRFCSLPSYHESPRAPLELVVTTVTWNVYSENPRTDLIYDLLNSKPADIVALEEVSWPALYADSLLSHIYPFVLDHQADSVPGIALLSVYPILAHGVIPGTVNDTDSSGAIWARVSLGANRTLLVVVGHPNSPYTHSTNCSPIRCFDPQQRNHQLAALRTFIEPWLMQGESVLLLGDMNVTPQEPMYRRLVTGLQDAQGQLHFGMGATWRPLSLRTVPFGVLRIDFMLSSPKVQPVNLTVDCTARGSDHCVVRGAFAVPMSSSPQRT